MSRGFFFHMKNNVTKATSVEENGGDKMTNVARSMPSWNKIKYTVLMVTIGLCACQFVQSGIKVAADKVSASASNPSSYINIKPSKSYYEYEKFKRSVSQPSTPPPPHKIPTLENLFQVVTFWDNLNQSSPCLYHGKKRTQHCHKRVLFDKAGYEKSLQDTRQLILNRLNLKQEPTINMNKNMLEFIEQIENKNYETDEYNEYDHTEHDDGYDGLSSMVKTKYDMKSSSDDKFITSMHDAVDVTRCSNRLQSMLDMNLFSESLQLEYDIMPFLSNSLCLRFQLPVKNFVKDLNSKGAVDLRKIKSAILWLYVKTKPSNWQADDESSSDDYMPSYERRQDDMLSLKITSLNDPDKSVVLEQSRLVDDWNTVDITKMIRSTVSKTLHQYKKNRKLKTEEFINLSIMIKCAKNCTIGLSKPTESPNTGFLGSNEYQSNADYIDSFYQNDVTVGSISPRKPLLSVSIYENRMLPDASNHQRSLDGVSGGAGSEKNSKSRVKRRVQNLNQNYRAQGLDKDTYLPRQCFNNYPDSNRECCLITYFVNFNSLKWSSWILSPSGFFANYCSGKCHDIKSFKYASHNAEIKIKYNENLQGKEQADANEILETCCHPISMDSLIIKYLANNGSIVNTVIPNMIITGCGCS